MNAYGLEASDAEHVSDVLITTQNLGKTTVGELASAMGRVIPNAKSAGVSIEQLGAAYAIMTANGISTDIATTDLNAMLIELNKSGSTVAQVIEKKTGKSFQQLQDDGWTLGDVMGLLMDAADGDTVKFQNLWSSVTAGQAATTIATAGVDKFNETVDAMGDSAGASQSAYETMIDTFEYKAQKLGNALTVTLQSIFNTDSSPFKIILDNLTDVVESIGGIIEGDEESNKKLAASVSVLMTNLGTFIADALPGVVSALAGVATGFADGIVSLINTQFGINMPLISSIELPKLDGEDGVFSKIAAWFLKITAWGAETLNMILGYEFISVDTQKMLQDATTWFNGFKDTILSVLKLTFQLFFPGQNEDGTVDDIPTRIQNWWDGVTSAVGNYVSILLGLFLPDDSEDGGESTATKIKNWFNGVVAEIGNFISITLGLFLPGENDGEETTVGERIEAWWKGVLGEIGNILNLTFGIHCGNEDEFNNSTIGKIVNWIKGVHDAGKSLINFTIDFLVANEENPSAFAEHLTTWWGNVKTAVGDLFTLTLGLPVIDEYVETLKTWWQNIVDIVKLFFKGEGSSTYVPDSTNADMYGDTYQREFDAEKNMWVARNDAIGYYKEFALETNYLDMFNDFEEFARNYNEGQTAEDSQVAKAVNDLNSKISGAFGNIQINLDGQVIADYIIGGMGVAVATTK